LRWSEKKTSCPSGWKKRIGKGGAILLAKVVASRNKENISRALGRDSSDAGWGKKKNVQHGTNKGGALRADFIVQWDLCAPTGASKSKKALR